MKLTRLQDNFTFRVLIILVGLSLSEIALAPTASADAVYTYTGNAFTFNQGLSCSPNCSPLTDSFTLAEPLPDNLPFGSISPLAFSFTSDGTNLTDSNSSYFALAVATDPNGIVDEWYFRVLKNPIGSADNIDLLTQCGFGGGCFDMRTDTTNYIPISASNSNRPGQWAAVPEPPSILLLGTGLLGIVFAVRRMVANI